MKNFRPKPSNLTDCNNSKEEYIGLKSWFGPHGLGRRRRYTPEL